MHLNATAFAVQSTFHTTLQQTPGQLVFGRDMIFNIKHTANWEYIRQRKQNLINKNNVPWAGLPHCHPAAHYIWWSATGRCCWLSAGRVLHEDKVGEKVLLKRGNKNKNI